MPIDQETFAMLYKISLPDLIGYVGQRRVIENARANQTIKMFSEDWRRAIDMICRAHHEHDEATFHEGIQELEDIYNDLTTI